MHLFFPDSLTVKPGKIQPHTFPFKFKKQNFTGKAKKSLYNPFYVKLRLREQVKRNKYFHHGIIQQTLLV